MMARKNQAVQFSTVAKVLLVSLFLGGSGVGYVLQKGQIRSLRIEREKNAARIRELEDHRRRIDAMLQEATGKARIHNAIAAHNIPLRATDLRRVYTLDEPRINTRRREVIVADN